MKHAKTCPCHVHVCPCTKTAGLWKSVPHSVSKGQQLHLLQRANKRTEVRCLGLGETSLGYTCLRQVCTGVLGGARGTSELRTTHQPFQEGLLLPAFSVGGEGQAQLPPAAPPTLRELQSDDVSFFEYLEKIELYCSKENHNLGIFRERENFELLF